MSRCFALAAASAVALTFATTAAADPPELGKATGGGEVAQSDDPFTPFKISFTAQNMLAPKGQVNFRAEDGNTFVGDVTCYQQEGNVASFSGPVERGKGGFDPEMYPGLESLYVVTVEDNGEGPGSPPDTISVSAIAAPPGFPLLCASGLQHTEPLVSGNIQVHQIAVGG